VIYLSYIDDIKGYKKQAEANVIGCFYKVPELYFNHEDLDLKDFTHNRWKVYFIIGRNLVKQEHKKELDDVSIGLYLEKHLKLKEKYEDYGGYPVIEDLTGLVSIENIDAYIKEVYKWKVVLGLIGGKFPVKDRLSDIKDMTLEELYNEYEAMLNDIFIDVETTAKAYDITHNLDNNISDWDEGIDVGLPLEGCELLNEMIGGNSKGHVTMVGASSGTGKTTVTILWNLPAHIRNKERIVVIINEQDYKDWQKEMVTWIINNVFHISFQKRRFRQGDFTDDEIAVLNRASKYMREEMLEKNITIIPLPTYSSEIVVKLIRKYKALGVDYFVLDTMKPNYSKGSNQSWLQMMEDSVNIYDAVKPEAKNVHIWITLQLTKSANRLNYLEQSNIGVSKNVADIASTLLLMRQMRVDEYDTLNIWKYGGKDNTTEIPVEVHKDRKYLVIFIDKNRFGESKTYQLVIEIDYGRNKIKEVGYCSIIMD
jgi:replicative DNA helicase